jgi:hypothetical protein
VTGFPDEPLSISTRKIVMKRIIIIAILGFTSLCWSQRHFAAWEQPELFTQELRAAFKSLS